MVCTKSQLSWLNLPHLPILLLPVTAKQRVVIIPEDQPEEGIDSYGGKDFEKRKVLRWECKTPQETSTSGPGTEYDDGDASREMSRDYEKIKTTVRHRYLQ